MRAPSKLDQRDAMLAQLVDAFMVDDPVRFAEASRWLVAYAHEVRAASGRVRINRNYYDPNILKTWKNGLAAAHGRKGGWPRGRKRSWR